MDHPLKTIGYGYDARGKRISVTMADGTVERTHYDGDGNVDRSKDGIGDVATLTYDGLNRLRSRTVPGGYASTFGYDYPSNGSLQTTSDRVANGVHRTTADVHNLAGQLVSSYQSAPNATVSYTYDDAGRKKTMSVGGETWTYAYVNGRLDTIQQSVGAGTVARYAYNPDDTVASRTSPEAHLRTDYGYNVSGRLSTLKHYVNADTSASLQQSITHTLNQEGNTTAYSDVVAGDPSYSIGYTYDLANRLTGEATRDYDSGAPIFENDYAYDALNNRTAVQRITATTNDTFGYSYASNDRFLSGEGYAVPLSAYDADGRPTSVTFPDGSVGSMAYDKEGQTTAMGAHGGVAAVGFDYDAAGRRVAQTGGVPAAFVFDGDTAIAEIGAGGAWTYRLPGVGYVQGGAQLYERENAQGSTVSTVDASGSVVSRSAYDAYGSPSVVQSGPTSRYGFAGEGGYAQDGATGALLCGARFYLPAIGRFLVPDPIGHDGGLNLYAYCDDNPVGRIDPTGHQGYEQTASNSWFMQQIGLPTMGWFSALNKTADWALGTGSDHRNFGPESLDVYQIRHSDIGFFINSAIIDANYMSRGPKTIGRLSNSVTPFISTLSQPSNGTQAFIGGYQWSASRYGDVISVKVHNETSMNSAFYHFLGLSSWKGWDRAAGGFGPMGTTYQDYRWTIPVPSYWRGR